MIKSMTAFAAAEETVGELTVKIEVRSYNSRHLDIFLRIPPICQPIEEKIKGLIADRFARGRLETRVQLDDRSDEASALEIDLARAKAVLSALRELKSQFDLKDDITLDMLTGAGGILKTVEKPQEEDIMWPAIKNCMIGVLDDLETMRKKEGAFIAKDFKKRLKFIHAHLKQIRKKSNGLLNEYQERLKERISSLTQNIVELDPADIGGTADIEEIACCRGIITAERQVLFKVTINVKLAGCI